jgi:transglutaminase-like putative cysteine protease
MNPIVSAGRTVFKWLGLDRGWVTFLLTGLVTGCLASSIVDAEWVKNSNPILTLMITGLVVGWLLGLSRWKGWQAALYSLVLSLAGVVNVIGRLLPVLQGWVHAPFLDSLNSLHVQLTVFALRVEGWVLTLQNGGSVQDTGLFVALAGLAGWSACAWLAWWILRRRQALVGLAPLALIMAVNVQLSHQNRFTLAWFFFFAMMLVVRTGFTQQKEGWTRRRVDYPDELGYEWGVSGMLIGVVVIVAALLASVFGTPEGWKALSEMVQRSQARMNQTAEQLFGGVHAPTPRPGEEAVKTIPSIQTPSLGEIGSPIPKGSQAVMNVWIDDPAPPPIDISGRGGPPIPLRMHYWRSQVMGEYTGRGWNPTALADAPPGANQVPDSSPVGRYLLKQRFEIVATHSGALFAVNEAVAVDNGVALKATQPDGSLLLVGSVDQYEVTSLATDATVKRLIQAGSAYPQALSQAYLQLPALPARVAQLAREVAGAGTPYEKAVRIQNYLRAQYKYDLGVKPAAPGRDVVDAFLFEEQAGFCSHFATAMAVLLRTQGVPARVVTGYAMGSYDVRKGMYVVPESASHAWVEVYFPGYGWVEFEPTPAYSSFNYPSGGAGAVDSAQPQNPENVKKPANIPAFVWILTLILLVSALWGYLFWRRAERRRVKDLNRLAWMVYGRVRRGLVLGGAPAAANLTPDEFAEVVRPALLEYPRLQEALTQATWVFIQSAYTPRAPDSYEIALCEQTWSSARMEWLRMILRRWVARKA